LKYLIVIQGEGHYPYFKSLIDNINKNNNVLIFYIKEKKLIDQKNKVSYKEKNLENKFSKYLRYHGTKIYLDKYFNSESYLFKRWQKAFPKNYTPNFIIKFLLEITKLLDYKKSISIHRYIDNFYNSENILRLIKLYKLFGLKFLSRKQFNTLNNDYKRSIIIKKLFLNNKIEHLILSPLNMAQNTEVNFLKEAKLLNIKISSFILSWDNVYTKGLIHQIPDKIFCWNINQKKYLIKYHLINSSKIKIAGSLFFEKWYIENKKIIKNINKNKILYLGSSSNITKNEEEIIIDLINYIIDYKKNYQLIIRSHPSKIINKKLILSRVRNTNNFKFELNNGIIKNPKSIFNKYADVSAIVGINTSAFIDFMFLKKPIFSILQKNLYFEQLKSKHLNILFTADVIIKINTIKELFSTITDIDKFDYHTKHKEFINEFIFPNPKLPPSSYILENLNVE